ELWVGIDEAADQPRTGDTVDLRVFACHPLARSSADVAARRQRLLSPSSDTAFQEVRLHTHEAQCRSHALANVASMNAVCDDLASARQIGSPLFDTVRRAMKRISYKRVGAGKVSIRPHVDDDR